MRKRSEILQLLREILWRPGVVVVLALYGLLQLISNLITWTLPAEDQAKYQFIKLINWRVLVLATPLLTIILLGLIIRAASTILEKREAEYGAKINRTEEAHKSEIEQKDKQRRSEQSELIEGHVKAETALIKLRETEVEGLQSRIRSLNEMYAKRIEEDRQRNDNQVSELRHKLSEQANQIYELSRPKLNFEVTDPIHNRVYLRHEVTTPPPEIEPTKIDRYLLRADIKICFENGDTRPRTPKKLRAALFRKARSGKEKEIPLTSSSVDVFEEGIGKIILTEMSILAGRITPNYKLDCYMEIPSRYGSRFNQNCFLGGGSRRVF
jgi:hypothetical protein